MAKKYKIILGIVAGIVIIAGLLWYYQQQGFIKVFPTSEDLRINKLLIIDRSKFQAPEGLDPAKFEEQVQQLEVLKQKVLDNPTDSAAWFNFGHMKEALNDHQGAVEVWEKAYELQPYNFITAGNLGNVYQYFLKDYPKAEFYYLKALEIQPDLTTVYTGLYDLYRYNWKEQQEKLEPLLLQAAEEDRQNQAEYFGELAEFFASIGDATKAQDYLNRVKALKPELAKELEETYPALKM